MLEYPKIPPDSPQAPPYSPQAAPHDQGPPPAGFDAPQPQPELEPQTSTIHGTTIIHTDGLDLGRSRKRMTCPNCEEDIRTRVTPEYSFAQHCFCLCMFVIGFWICSPIPYFMDGMTNIVHTCPNCGAHLGTYKQVF